MKYSKYLVTSALTLSFLIACSSDDGNNATPEAPTETPTDSGNTDKPETNDPSGDTDKPTNDDNSVLNFPIDSTRKTVVIQAETATLNTDWQLKTTIDGYNGTGYIVWEGPDLFWREKIQTSSALKYNVQIDEPGTFEFKWRSVVGKGSNTTEHNDTWLKIPDADDFYTYVNRDFVFNGKKDDQGKKIEIKLTNAPGKFYPNGSEKTPTGIAGENKQGYMKIFMNSANWTEIASTWDHNGFRVFAEFKNKGTYTIEIVPRSSFHAIDEFKLIPIKEN
ncbi:hypothetical protein [Aquimarina agarilytica]|uniref:hypothetical protein n=1 Tax=Aquimarina agarilytica TaxID=1087449 RepID=UPI000288FD33|nr:hypothetical protein [Aquimarina agarilytica]